MGAGRQLPLKDGVALAGWGPSCNICPRDWAHSTGGLSGLFHPHPHLELRRKGALFRWDGEGTAWHGSKTCFSFISLSYSHSLFFPLFFSLSLTQSFSLPLSLLFSLSHSIFLSPSFSPVLSLSRSFPLPLSLLFSLTQSFFPLFFLTVVPSVS